jgi:hypothetical protein
MAIVRNVIAKAGYHKVGVAWLAPLDVFDHVRVLYKLGSAPANDTDGTYVDYSIGDPEISVDFGDSLGLGGYFQYESSDVATPVYFQIYTYATPDDPAPEMVQKTAAPGAGGLKISPYAGTLQDQTGVPIVVGTDTWLVKAVNARLNPLVSPGDLFYELESNAITDENFVIDSLNNGISVVTDYADDLLWHDDTIVFEVWKNGSKLYQSSKKINLYQATHSYTQFPGGTGDPDLLSQLILQAPANQLPLAPDIVAGQDTSTTDLTPTVMWYHRADIDNVNNEIHYAVEYATAQTLVGGSMQVDDTHASYRAFLSIDNPEYFEYSTDGGSTWTSFTTLAGAGLVLAEDSQNQVRCTVPAASELSVGQWYWQVRATDKTLA